MSRVKSDLSLLSLNQLCQLTGHTYRTLVGRLARVQPASTDGGTKLYVPAEVLRVIYAGTPALDDEEEGELDGEGPRKLDPVQQKARLDKLRADKVQLEIDVMKGTLVPAEKVEATWSKMTSAFRQKILALPSKVAPKVCATKDAKKVEAILKQECDEALTELAGYDGGSGRDQPSAQSS